MATWTKANLADQVLEFVGVKPAGQSAFGEHANLAKSVIDSVYDQLQDIGLAPYSVEEIPEWAQWPMVKYIAFEIGPRFGKNYGERVRDLAKREMAGSVFGGPRGDLPTPSKDY